MQAVPIIKNANPDAIIVGPAVACNSAGVSFLQSIKNLGAFDYLDVISLHFYIRWWHTESFLNQLKAIAGDKPIWITETGWDSVHQSGGESAQNTYLQEALNPTNGYLKDGIDKVFYYCLNDAEYPVTSEDEGWGLTYGPDRNYMKKQAYSTFKQYIAASAPPTPTPTATPTPTPTPTPSPTPTPTTPTSTPAPTPTPPTNTPTPTPTPPTATIESSNSAAEQKDFFALGESVYVVGNGYSPSTTYNLYMVDDVVTWSDGMTIPTRVAGTVTDISSNSTGDIPPTIAWSNPQTASKYDIVVDVNSNGVYDDRMDALDDSDIEVTAGTSIPEFSPFHLLTLFIAFAILAVLSRKAQQKRQSTRVI